MHFLRNNSLFYIMQKSFRSTCTLSWIYYNYYHNYYYYCCLIVSYEQDAQFKVNFSLCQGILLHNVLQFELNISNWTYIWYWSNWSLLSCTHSDSRHHESWSSAPRLIPDASVDLCGIWQLLMCCPSPLSREPRASKALAVSGCNWMEGKLI